MRRCVLSEVSKSIWSTCIPRILWQTPNHHPSDENTHIWYTRGYLSKNTLASFMSRMSKEAHLSRIYTNHSVHVTGITILKRAGYSDKQVIAVSGHKSVQSLAIYPKVNNMEKQHMGNTMFHTMQDKMPCPLPLLKPQVLLSPAFLL